MYNLQSTKLVILNYYVSGIGKSTVVFFLTMDKCIINLKRQCHKIFDPRFFHRLITPRPQINTL
jgi:hypothetical protein